MHPCTPQRVATDAPQIAGHKEQRGRSGYGWAARAVCLTTISFVTGGKMGKKSITWLLYNVRLLTG